MGNEENSRVYFPEIEAESLYTIYYSYICDVGLGYFLEQKQERQKNSDINISYTPNSQCNTQFPLEIMISNHNKGFKIKNIEFRIFAITTPKYLQTQIDGKHLQRPMTGSINLIRDIEPSPIYKNCWSLPNHEMNEFEYDYSQYNYYNSIDSVEFEAVE